MPRADQEAFSIVTQILEYWQNNYFTEGLNISDPAGNQESPNKVGEQEETLKSDTNRTSEANRKITYTTAELPELEMKELSYQETLNAEMLADPKTDASIEPKQANDNESLDPKIVDDSKDLIIDKDAEIVEPASQQSNEPNTIITPEAYIEPEEEKAMAKEPSDLNPTFANTLNENVATTLEAPTSVDQSNKVAVRTEAKETNYFFGRTVNPSLKQDGAWNFHTTLRFIKSDNYVLETIFSKPTKTQPVPKATASVWFDLEKKENTWFVKYRFECNYQEHLVTFNEGVTKTGLTDSDKEQLKCQAMHLANPLKRTMDLIESKILSSVEMDRINLFQDYQIAAQSKYLPSPLNA